MAHATANSTIARHKQISAELVKFVTETIKAQTKKQGDHDLAVAYTLGAVMSLLQHEVALGSEERQERLESELKERVRLLQQDGLPTPQSIFRS
jgi:hypothetical protein